MRQKFVGYFNLVEACRRSGCPVCRCVAAHARRYLDSVIYEQVTDPATRARLRASWGFCNTHTWMLLDVDNAYAGAATLYADVLAVTERRLQRLAGRATASRFFSRLPWPLRRPPAIVEAYRRRAVCPACDTAARAEDAYAELCLAVGHDHELAEAYAGSDGLCVPHLMRALALASARAEVDGLLDRTLAKWREVRVDLDSFVRKHDYRNRQPFTEAEVRSYRRGAESLAGADRFFVSRAGAGSCRTRPR